MVQQGIVVAVEVHNDRNYGDTVRQLVEMCIPIKMGVVLGYKTPYMGTRTLDNTGYERRPNEIPDANDDGFVSQESLDRLFSYAELGSALHIIVNGEFYRGCHETAVESILQRQKEKGIENVSYHFIADKIRTGGTGDLWPGSIWELFENFDIKSTDFLNRDVAYRDVAMKIGFTPLLFINGVQKDSESQGEVPTVKLYYWGTSQTFKENLDSILT